MVATVTPLPTAPDRSTQDRDEFVSITNVFLAALVPFVPQVNALAEEIEALAAFTNYAATSTTSLTIGTGSKALTIETGKLFSVGQFAYIARTSAPSNFMIGQVTAHNPSTGSLTVNVASGGTSGSGTYTDWTVSIALPSSIYATLAGAETLTNKTLTAPTINTPAVSNGTFSSPAITGGTIAAPGITDPVITGAILEDIYTISDGASVDLDPSNGTIQLWTLGANRTPTATNWQNGESMTLMVDDGSARTITWTTIGVNWVGGTAPVLPTSGYGVIELWKTGGTVRGCYSGPVA